MAKIISLALGGFSRFFKKAVKVNRRLYGNSLGQEVRSLSKQEKRKKG